ncbi:MAG: BMP family ABC transporter substrate-binding protein [Candidatus Thorarchaeota archaeon]
MKFRLKDIFFVILLFFCFISINFHIILPHEGTARSNQEIKNIAIILDSPEFYDSHFINDVLNGFDLVNQTYNINYTVFQLTNYSRPPITYYYNNSMTNLTQMVNTIYLTEKYDLIVLMGYELRRTPLDYSEFTAIKFLYYDISAEKPNRFPKKAEDYPKNVALVSFNESQSGFIAGTLAAQTLSPQPQKIAMICSYRNSWPNDVDPKSDPRTWQLIAGFQSGFLRNTTEVELSIVYIDYYWESWTNSEKAKELAEELDKQDFDLIFSPLQNNNTLGILEGFTKPVVTVDSNRSIIDGTVRSVVKNNTKAILTIFEEFNKSEDNFSGIHTLGLEENVFYPNGWGNVTRIMEQIYTDVVISNIVIPTDIKHAENTPGFEIFALLCIILYVPLRKKLKK